MTDPIIQLILFIPGYAFLNRLAGRDEWFPGRNIYAVAPIAGILAGVLTGSVVFGCFAFLAWVAYRVPGWWGLNDMGRNNPNYRFNPGGAVARDFIRMIPRQGFYGGVLAALMCFGTNPELSFILIALAFAGSGLLQALGYLFGHCVWVIDKSRTPGKYAEPAAGAAMGATTLYLAAIYLTSNGVI